MEYLTSFIPLLIVVGLVIFLIRISFKKNKAGKKETVICSSCGTVGSVKVQTRGSIAIEIILWLFFIVPGLIYSVWRLTTKEKVCGACGNATLIPLNTPAGKKLANEFASH